MIALLGLGFGIVLWHVAGVVTGDALFHLGRVQKLYAFGDLHVRSVDEFSDGGLHPGSSTPSPCGTRSLRSSRRSAESVRRR